MLINILSNGHENLKSAISKYIRLEYDDPILSFFEKAEDKPAFVQNVHDHMKAELKEFQDAIKTPGASELSINRWSKEATWISTAMKKWQTFCSAQNIALKIGTFVVSGALAAYTFLKPSKPQSFEA